MARKTIYIKDEDLQIFERAEQIGGESISAIIADALEKYIEVKELEKTGMGEREIEVGRFGARGDDYDVIKFIGREIAHYQENVGETSSGDDRYLVHTVFQTAKGKLLYYREFVSLWERDTSRREYFVVENIEELKNIDGVHVPASVIREAKESLEGDGAVFLDI